MRLLRRIAIVLLVLIIIYFLGPSPKPPHYTADLPVVPAQADAIERYIDDQEAQHKVKPGNEAGIIWADSTHSPTPYAVIYLHGFSASHEEGNPVHREFAKRFGCNLLLTRLADHGIDTTEPLLNFTAERLWNTAKQAYAIGKRLGKKIIIMATSTGGTLALKLAGEYPDIAGLILLSPNIAINDPNAWLLNNHWGLQIARLVKGKYNVSADTSSTYARYWNNRYRMEAAVQLEELLETTMKTSTFKKVTQPVLMLYYFRDKHHQDKVVKVSAMKRMFGQLGTPDSLKKAVAIADAGDHVLGSPIKSKAVPVVINECLLFGEKVLRLNSIAIDTAK